MWILSIDSNTLFFLILQFWINKNYNSGRVIFNFRTNNYLTNHSRQRLFNHDYIYISPCLGNWLSNSADVIFRKYKSLRRWWWSDFLLRLLVNTSGIIICRLSEEGLEFARRQFHVHPLRGAERSAEEKNLTNEDSQNKLLRELRCGMRQ